MFIKNIYEILRRNVTKAHFFLYNPIRLYVIHSKIIIYRFKRMVFFKQTNIHTDMIKNKPKNMD